MRAAFTKGMSVEDKLREILISKRMEDMVEDERRASTYLLMDLFFRGYQQVGRWTGNAWPVYDSDPVEYQENRFRRNVLINAGMMIRMESAPVFRPSSGSIEDIEAAASTQDGWEKAKEEILYDRVVADKSLMKPLFGNCFIYSGYQVSRRFGTIMEPKYGLQDVEIPGGAMCIQCGMQSDYGQQLCPQCGAYMQQFAPTLSQTPGVTGFAERAKGSLFSTVYSPLEIKARAKIKGGTANLPYLLRIMREDTEAVEYAFSNFKWDASKGQVSGSSDTIQRYLRMLNTIPGNPHGAGQPPWSTAGEVSETDVVMGWLAPQTFRRDEDLLRTFPDGAMAVLAGAQLVDLRAERLTDVWTHEVYYPNAHGFYGDGMYDDVPIQRSINRIGQLQERHLEYDTIPLRLYDNSLVSPNDVSNDPALKWVPVQTTLDRGLDKAVRDLPPQSLSWDVNALKADRLRADQDTSGATDPLAGQVSGANTPYSAQLLAVEQGQTRFIPSARYNKDSVKDHARQVMQLAKTHWTDPRTMVAKDINTGRSTSKTFTGADLGRGSWDVYVGDADFKPKTRGEQMQALDLARQYGVDILATPRMRLQFFEKIGLDASGDIVSTQARRAGRIIEWYREGKVYLPHPFLDDGIVQSPVIEEFLASPQGDDLAIENPEAHQGLIGYIQTVMQMAMMKMMAMGGMGMPMLNAGAGKSQGAQGQGPAGQKQEFAQSPVSPEKRMPMPSVPARQQQAAGTLPK